MDADYYLSISNLEHFKFLPEENCCSAPVQVYEFPPQILDTKKDAKLFDIAGQ